MTSKACHRNLFIISIISIGISGCGPSQTDSQASLASIPSPRSFILRPQENPGPTLAEFDYSPAFDMVTATAARIGCERALHWLAYPKSGDLRETIRVLHNAEDPYQTLQTDLWDSPEALTRCKQAITETSAMDAGFARLLDQVVARNKSLTIIAVGGFGSHEASTHFLPESAARWQASAKQRHPDRFQMVRYECPDSYQSDDVCAPHLANFWQEIDQKANAHEQAYLFLGYSKGGSTVIQALSESQSMRDKTLAGVTFASPIGGGVAALLPNYLMSDDGSAKTRPEELINILVNANDVWQWIKGLRQIIEGAEFQKPAARHKYLSEVLAKKIFYRTDGSTLPFFHTAGTLELTRMTEALPRLQRGEELLEVDTSHIQRDAFIQLLTTPLFSDYPIFDSTVTIEHAVIPKRFLPKGASAELIALFRFDHLQFRQEADQNTVAGNSPDVAPHAIMMDALLDVVTSRVRTNNSLTAGVPR